MRHPLTMLNHKLVAYVKIQFQGLSDEQLKKLHQAEALLLEIGVSFDVGGNREVRDWEMDWSLKGPVKVYFKELGVDDLTVQEKKAA